MQQLGSIPKFKGNESPQDAETWLETLVEYTGNFTDSGILRLLTTKFSSGSPAREWFDNLDDASKEKWTAFEKQFRSRWIAESRRLADQEIAWNAFTKHCLNIDDLLSNETSYNDLNDTIVVWVEEHIRMGKATARDDTTLITATLQLLPTFISAYIQVHFPSPHSSFDSYCAQMCEIPVNILAMERIRRQMHSTDRISSIERKVDEIWELMKQLIVMKSTGVQTPLAAPLNRLPGSEVQARTGTPSGEGVLTPQTPPLGGQEGAAISDPTEETKFLTPRSIVSIPMPRKELVVITKRAIDSIRPFIGSFNQTQWLNILITLLFHDRITGSRTIFELGVLANDGSSDPCTTELFHGLYCVHFYTAHGRNSTVHNHLHKCIVFSDELNERRTTAHVIMPSQVHVSIQAIPDQWRDIQLHLQRSGQPTMAGGLFIPDANENVPYVGSIRTVLFMTVSSYEAEFADGEETRTKIALQSAECIKAWMLDSTISLIKDCNINASTTREKSGASVLFYLSGIAVEGFSVLASITHDESWRSLAIKIATAAMHYKEWHDPDGILTVGGDENALKDTNNIAFKGLLNRGLLVAYQRNRSNGPFCDLVRSYINAQCNAILNFSRSGDSYGVDWRGPPPGPTAGPTAHSQLAAIDTLIAAIGVNEVDG